MGNDIMSKESEVTNDPYFCNNTETMGIQKELLPTTHFGSRNLTFYSSDLIHDRYIDEVMNAYRHLLSMYIAEDWWGGSISSTTDNILCIFDVVMHNDLMTAIVAEVKLYSLNIKRP